MKKKQIKATTAWAEVPEGVGFISIFRLYKTRYAAACDGHPVIRVRIAPIVRKSAKSKRKP